MSKRKPPEFPVLVLCSVLDSVNQRQLGSRFDAYVKEHPEVKLSNADFYNKSTRQVFTVAANDITTLEQKATRKASAIARAFTSNVIEITAIEFKETEVNLNGYEEYVGQALLIAKVTVTFIRGMLLPEVPQSDRVILVRSVNKVQNQYLLSSGEMHVGDLSPMDAEPVGDGATAQSATDGLASLARLGSDIVEP